MIIPHGHVRVPALLDLLHSLPFPTFFEGPSVCFPNQRRNGKHLCAIADEWPQSSSATQRRIFRQRGGGGISRHGEFNYLGRVRRFHLVAVVGSTGVPQGFACQSTVASSYKRSASARMSR